MGDGPGLTVFVISWVNPDGKLAHKDFEDYLTEGTLAALGAIEKATGEKEVNAVGYCLGGTLLAATLAYMAATKDKRIVSATFMTSLVDFSRAGELEVFIDEDQVASLERKMSERGYLEGSEMANTFNMLRSNDLIWSFVINNYLLGRDPFPFDLLHWNCDSTRMPAKMHSFYLRNMYMKNLCAFPVPSRLRACRSTSRKSPCRRISSPRSRTTSRRGRRPTPARSWSPASRGSCSPDRGTSPA
jgi:polyhydroxyalkanoate synthase